ncbi:MAG: hypothetical protein Aseana_30950 [Candidatus Pelagadaptatus aseana]|uniref:response regulator n=1 Tax=Candidatus Pelagadaptatus aseana TaxID=3120508 RepID=UPI0039B1DD31
MQLFSPSSKVQRDRNILRESDARLAKYSRRGIVFALIAYTICLAYGYLRVMEPRLAVILTVGFFIICVVRAFFLLRFEPIYAKGPQRWRNLYFAFTLLGAAWWSVILISVTLTLGMVGETPILWLYTVIFQATVTSSLSPYKKFSRVYQFISIIPPTLAALWMGGFDGYMYSVMMFIFYIMLHQQVDTLHDNYWQRLEANYALTQRTKVLEAEKRNVNASVDLNAEFLSGLGREFRASLNDILGGLTLLTDSKLTKEQQDLLKLAEKAGESQLDLVNNVVDFAKINSRNLVLENSIFNLRTRIEQWVSELSTEAHQQCVELDYQLTSELPLRVNGDMKRVGQVFNNLVSNCIKLSEHGHITTKVQFERTGESSGYLEFQIIDQYFSGTEITDNHSTSKVSASDSSLWLALCKGLVECMSGSLETGVTEHNERQYLVRLPLEVSNTQPSLVRSLLKLHGQRALLLTDKEIDTYWLKEVESWGISIETVYSIEKAQLRLDDAGNSEHPFSVLMIQNLRTTPELLDFSQGLLYDDLHQSLNQIFLLRHSDDDNSELTQLIANNSKIANLYRPVIGSRIHELLCHMLFQKPLSQCSSEEHFHQMGEGKEALLVDDHRVNQLVAEGMLKKLGYGVNLASNGFEALKIVEEKSIDIIFMDCQMPEMDGFDATRAIRELEQKQGKEGRHIPIVAMTAHTEDSDKASCFAAGMDDYLAKPVRYEDLEARLIRWLGR